MSTATLTERTPLSQRRQPLDAHVVLLTNYIPPYAQPVYAALSERVRKLTILLSTPMEPNRNWNPQWGSLDVRLQRTLTLQRPWRHPTGFSEKMCIHLPLDTTRQLRRLQPNVIISAQFGLRSVLAAIYAAIWRTPLVLFVNLSEHQEKSRGWIRHLVRKWLIRRADCLAVNGQSGSRYLRRLGADPQRVFIVPYVALPNLFDQFPLERPVENAHKLFYAGQLIERKGLLPFLDSLARWAVRNPQRQVVFEIAGSGPLEPQLRALEVPPNLTLRMLGECSYDQVARCYASAGILVFPTLSDEWGLVVNEALAAGVPVLGSKYSQAVEDLCLPGQTGWQFRPDDRAEMDEAIAQALATSAEELNQMRRNGRELVSKLTPAYAAEQFVATIEAVMAAKEQGTS